jgi:AraC-like DNA-binding protein
MRLKRNLQPSLHACLAVQERGGMMAGNVDSKVIYSKAQYYFPAWKAESVFRSSNVLPISGAQARGGGSAGVGRQGGDCISGKSMTVIRDAFLREVSNSWIETEQVTQEMLDDLGIGIDLSEPMLLLAERINQSAIGDSYNRNDGIYQSFKKYLPFDCSAIYWPMRLDMVFWVLQSHNPEGLRPGSLGQSLARLRIDCAKKLGVDISFTVLQRPISFFELQQASQKLVEQMETDQAAGIASKAESGPETPGEHTRERNTTSRTGEGISIQTIEYMESMLLQGRRKEFFDELKKYWYGVAKTENMNNIFMTEMYFSVSLVLLRCMGRITVANNIDDKALHDLSPRKFFEFSSWDEAIAHITKTAETLMALCETHKESYEIHLLKYVKQYVDEHVYDRVSLSDIAVYTKYNPAYISRIFKKQNGVTLSVYINQVRMNKAKEMLAKSSLSVYEIAGRTGFESPQYFATVFKKSTGFSPKQYRLVNGN